MGVLGIGGLFFRARDPEALSAWYRDHLGIGAGCAATGADAGDPWSWQTLGVPVVFAPFPSDSDYFAADKAFLLNLRVAGLAGMIEQLRAAGITVLTDDAWNSPEAGTFARLHDPEGNGVELWEPPA
jgi:catechol 2,3-dioxygenase-like lactoylglutathione lyase family enzyme